MNYRIVFAAVACVAVSGILPGCGNSNSKYVPSKATAQSALKKTLETWKGGAEFKPIQADSMNINVFDGRWRDGKKLESFEIVEEVKNTDRPTFKVKMKIAEEPEATVTYYVIGINPLNVFRDEDYEQTKTW